LFPGAPASRLERAIGKGVMGMPDNSPDVLSLFDGEDVDVGDEAPEDDDQQADELAGIRASQDDPDTPPADTTEAS